MGQVQCCDNDVAPPDLRVERPIIARKSDNIESLMQEGGITMDEEEVEEVLPVLGYWNIRGLAQ